MILINGSKVRTGGAEKSVFKRLLSKVNVCKRLKMDKPPSVKG